MCPKLDVTYFFNLSGYQHGERGGKKLRMPHRTAHPKNESSKSIASSKAMALQRLDILLSRKAVMHQSLTFIDCSGDYSVLITSNAKLIDTLNLKSKRFKK